MAHGLCNLRCVWYLLLLHHSQTMTIIYSTTILVCTFCFCIILKLTPLSNCSIIRFVPSAFTSFSNTSTLYLLSGPGLYLLLLHHSQTDRFGVKLLRLFDIFYFYIILKHISSLVYCIKLFGIFYFYIILKLRTQMFDYIEMFGIFYFYIILKPSVEHSNVFVSLVSSTFTSFSNPSLPSVPGSPRLVSSTFTSFSNEVLMEAAADFVWYLLLLHHSQTIDRGEIQKNNVWYLLLLHHSQTSNFKNEILIISMKQIVIYTIQYESFSSSHQTKISCPLIIYFQEPPFIES